MIIIKVPIINPPYFIITLNFIVPISSLIVPISSLIVPISSLNMIILHSFYKSK